MSIVLLGATSGSITLSEPAVAGTNTISLPASTGTMALTSQLAGTGYGDIGSYVAAFCTGLDRNVASSVAAGTTFAASTLVKETAGVTDLPWSSSSATASTSTGLSGTWRLVQNYQNPTSFGATSYQKAIFVRVS